MRSSGGRIVESQRIGRVVVSLALIFGSVLGLAALSHGSTAPPRMELKRFPEAFGSWQGTDVPIDEKTQQVLGATDLLNRSYQNLQGNYFVGFFIGFFASQRQGGAIHSPKNCLPGAGWEIAQGGTTSLLSSGTSAPLMVNQYIIEKGLDKQIVLYWYQTQGQVIASEYSAKFYLVWDALSRNRTDGALVRIVVPIRNEDEQSAAAKAQTFAQAIYPQLAEYIPN